MSVLSDKKVLIGISGGIAAYKIPILVRLLIKLKSSVRIVMTPNSKNFVSPLTLSTLSRNEVLSSFTKEEKDNPTWNNHVELAKWSDLMIIAPATSNTISSMANAKCDNHDKIKNTTFYMDAIFAGVGGTKMQIYNETFIFVD